MRTRYLFWYQFNKNDKITYYYVVAKTHKQARYFWLNFIYKSVGRCYDYVDFAISEEEETEGHAIGSIYYN